MSCCVSASCECQSRSVCDTLSMINLACTTLASALLFVVWSCQRDDILYIYINCTSDHRVLSRISDSIVVSSRLSTRTHHIFDISLYLYWYHTISHSYLLHVTTYTILCTSLLAALLSLILFCASYSTTISPSVALYTRSHLYLSVVLILFTYHATRYAAPLSCCTLSVTHRF